MSTDLKTYLGDAVYADCDDRGIVLTTENGICETNTIVLEEATLTAFERYVERLRGAARARKSRK